MIRRLETDYGIIEYELEMKKVKNINLRVRPDMTVHVSANRRTSTRTIDDFVRSKAEMITTAIETKVTTTIGTLEFKALKLFKISPKIPTLTFTKDF